MTSSWQYLSATKSLRATLIIQNKFSYIFARGTGRQTLISSKNINAHIDVQTRLKKLECKLLTFPCAKFSTSFVFFFFFYYPPWKVGSLETKKNSIFSNFCSSPPSGVVQLIDVRYFVYDIHLAI